MREFDDASLLASNTPVAQLNPSIADLQRIRREAEDQQVPSCLTTLKQYQLAHMNTVINTMLYMLSYQGSDTETEALNQGIALARQQHDQYILELANVLGLTVVAAPTAAATEGTPEAGATSAPASVLITNPGPTVVNLRTQPDLNANSLGILDIGAGAVVLGRTADTLWYQVEFPGQAGQTAWVYAPLVQLSDPSADIAIVNSTP
jgi:Bacterial SH3 domain